MERVTVDEKEMDAYVKAAKKAFPRETFAFLLGRDTGTERIIDLVFMPENQDKFCTPNYVIKENDEWIKVVKKLAKTTGLQVLGEIHSHCYKEEDAKTCDNSLSFADIQSSDFVRYYFKQKAPIIGLLVLRKPKYRMRAEVIFYPEIQIYRARIK